MGRKIIDLSVACSNETEGVSIRLQGDLPVYFGHECYAYDLEIKSHRGTYFETGGHLFRDGKNTDEIELERLILPGVCLRVKCAGRCVGADELERASAGLVIPAGAALLVDTGPGDERDFKYFGADAGRWMAGKQIALMGSSSCYYDNGFEEPTGFFVELFEAGIPIIANLANLHLLGDVGFEVMVLPLKIAGVCTVPCRVIGVVE